MVITGKKWAICEQSCPTYAWYVRLYGIPSPSCLSLSLSLLPASLSLSLFSCRSLGSLCAICNTRITIGPRKLDGRPSSDFAALTYKTTTREVNYILPTTPGLYADRDNKTSREATRRFLATSLELFDKKRGLFSHTVARIREETMKIYSYNVTVKGARQTFYFR